MTNKEDEVTIANDPRAAAMTALHLVGEVIDEANVIVNAAHESGQPHRYVSMLRSLRNGSLMEPEHVDMSYLISKGDCDTVVKNNSELIATSTPQKFSAELKRNKSETNLVGQGDEQNELQQHELTKSTSMFINNMFDMSEVESAMNDANNISNTESDMPKYDETDANDVITRAMSTLMESFVYTAINAAFTQHNKMINETYLVSQDNTKPNFSDYAFIGNAGDAKYANDISFFINENGLSNNGECYVDSTTCRPGDAIDLNEEISKHLQEKVSGVELSVESTTCDPKEAIIINVAKEDGVNVEETNVTLDENLYLTLNRDYEQYSEEGDQITQDTKNLNLHEIELLTAQTSEVNLTSRPEEPLNVVNDMAAVSGVSTSASAKSSLESRGPGSVCGICPLSPDARRRASSLLDQRRICSPSPRRAHRKFNTLNEALVKTSRWKDSYTFETKFDESGEF